LGENQPLTSAGIFVTGTDTGVGKTRVACALLRAFALSGLRAVGMKPVATGCRVDAPDRENEDVASLIAASNVRVPVDLINPYCFEPAIAPHLAAQQAGSSISMARIRECYLALTSLADRVVVEGAGGLLVPLNEREDFGDLVRILELPVLVVVGMRLGCLNHALLTAEAIQSRGLRFAGWVANQLQSQMPQFEQNVQVLRERLEAPLTGIIPFGSDGGAATVALDLDLLENRIR
jgi:dethiobiotin synthetase